MILLHIGGQISASRLEAAILWVLTLVLIWLHVTLLGLFKSRSVPRQPAFPSERRVRKHRRWMKTGRFR